MPNRLHSTKPCLPLFQYSFLYRHLPPSSTTTHIINLHTRPSTSRTIPILWRNAYLMQFFIGLVSVTRLPIGSLNVVCLVIGFLNSDSCILKDLADCGVVFLAITLAVHVCHAWRVRKQAQTNWLHIYLRPFMIHPISKRSGTLNMLHRLILVHKLSVLIARLCSETKIWRPLRHLRIRNMRTRWYKTRRKDSIVVKLSMLYITWQ